MTAVLAGLQVRVRLLHERSVLPELWPRSIHAARLPKGPGIMKAGNKNQQLASSMQNALGVSWN